MRGFLFLIAAIVLAGVAYIVLRDDGLLEQVTAKRVEQALAANGAPEPLAQCMGEKLADRLSIEQLRKLEALAPREGESRVPQTTREALSRVKRVDDPEAVRVLGETGASCTTEILRAQIEAEFERLKGK
ncbi:MAG: hypothetical protein AAFR64_09640 [Pseudomonadota bacterium]